MVIPDTLLEEGLWAEGFKILAGVDEAGRGPWAGPVTVGAVVIMPGTVILESVRDSKSMTTLARESAYEQIVQTVAAWGVGEVSADAIDEIGIQAAARVAMKSALVQVEERLGVPLDYLICDGRGILKIPGYKIREIVKGDTLHYSIAAASILAKVHRDRIMHKYAKIYPEYGFERHVGYGTAFHQEMLEKYGPCGIHRKSYKPVGKLLR